MTMSAFSSKDKVADNGYVVVPADRLSARRTVGRRENNGFVFRNSVDADVQKTADRSTEGYGKYYEKHNCFSILCYKVFCGQHFLSDRLKKELGYSIYLPGNKNVGLYRQMNCQVKEYIFYIGKWEKIFIKKVIYETDYSQNVP